MTEERKETKDKFAVIETGGKQYLVKPGDKLMIEKIRETDRGNVISFDKVLLLSNEKGMQIGDPHVSGAKIRGERPTEKKGEKITMMRYKSKTRQSRKKGHRQIYTEVTIGDF